ncbi:MAG: hypothetical protein QME60_07090 [Verrucomicrobiota bacterium]|nr:hypothetical protein [Verrucomicrobiota bacterium]
MNTVKQVRETVARERNAQARLAAERNRLARVLNGLALLICGAWIGLLALSNAVERRMEIGAWQTLGWGFPRVSLLVGGKWCLLAFMGSAGGFVGGTIVAVSAGGPEEAAAQAGLILAGLSDVEMLGLVLAVGLGLALLGSCIPLAYLARQDPAVALQGE